MSSIARVSAALLGVLAPFAMAASPGITVPAVTVGRNLQSWAVVTVPEAPSEPMQLTLTSDNPSRLLLSKTPEQAGSASITLTVGARRVRTPEFWLHALGDSGTATYTIAAKGAGSAKGTVNLSPSAIVIVGPHRAPKFLTTSHANASRITIVSVILDASRKVAGEQPVSGGSPVEVSLSNSNPGAGALGAAKLTIAGGSSSANTSFQPAGEGDAILAPVQPPGFAVPSEMASVVATIAKPGIAIAGDLFLGKDLQDSAAVCLGEPAPADGLKVTLTSRDPSKLLLSAAEDQPGSASITLTIPAGQQNATYYMQALGGSGEVEYEAAAPGFRSRTATIWLAPSGVILAYERYGPPEEANVKQKHGVVGLREFYISRADAEKHPVRVVAWSAYLDRDSRRAADFTIQPLRAGLNLEVPVTSSNPAVGKVDSPLVIKSGSNRAFGDFTPLADGTTVLSVQTPAGFAPPANATTLPANVVK